MPHITLHKYHSVVLYRLQSICLPCRLLCDMIGSWIHEYVPNPSLLESTRPWFCARLGSPPMKPEAAIARVSSGQGCGLDAINPVMQSPSDSSEPNGRSWHRPFSCLWHDVGLTLSLTICQEGGRRGPQAHGKFPLGMSVGERLNEGQRNFFQLFVRHTFLRVGVSRTEKTPSVQLSV